MPFSHTKRHWWHKEVDLLVIGVCMPVGCTKGNMRSWTPQDCIYICICTMHAQSFVG